MPASALPSLLRNLTSTSRSTASLSLDSPSTSTLSSDDSHSIASSTRNTSHARRRRVVSGPPGGARKESPTSTTNPRSASHERPVLSTTLSQTSQVSTAGDETEESSAGRSRASSDSSLEGLTARLHGARKGRGSGKANKDGTIRVQVDGEGKKEDPSNETEPSASTKPEKQTSIPTISLSTGEVDSTPGRTTRISTPSLDDPPLPLTTTSPFASAQLSTHSSLLPDIDPPPAIKINSSSSFEDTPSQDPETTAISSFSPPHSNLSDNDSTTSSSSSAGDEEEEEDEEEEGALVDRSESHPDPREMLRAQLAKAGSGRGDQREIEKEVERRVAMNRTVSGMSSKSVGAGEMGEMGMKRLERRRYFILSTAGKLVYTS